MGEGKVEVLLRISEVNLDRAGRRLEAGEYDTATFHASMAAESAANAMILKLGGDEAKDHRTISGLAVVIRRVKPELLTKGEYVRLIERGREIQREILYSRYPLILKGKWVTPMEYYTHDKAQSLIDSAKFIVNTVKKYLKGARD